MVKRVTCHLLRPEMPSAADEALLPYLLTVPSSYYLVLGELFKLFKILCPTLIHSSSLICVISCMIEVYSKYQFSWRLVPHRNSFGAMIIFLSRLGKPCPSDRRPYTMHWRKTCTPAALPRSGKTVSSRRSRTSGSTSRTRSLKNSRCETKCSLGSNDVGQLSQSVSLSSAYY